ncbi:MAG: V-type ATP synthase subunit B [Deltaproteobacteria bacterium RIFCSPLOWO2_12_FULL_43_16]|nr:MAG: V-type ATP synthase subunit B [Deltaproteobacteria bacterium GWA2_43_19]OGQ10512.1 MAG: V-type ATP synthase subunit B [Deltaproteobacteria bacterium RIFCSPHIGHO2_02_FULL_43_33]OGQ37208.1 MAG: V-type ATP synthase subunit B [Deltaproteobacteria bacterium RIFCSPLOWO2_01_FULL_42_9]OGQ59510.1 MAG: V-type ATP synthase subunit B [Deltaproteobacteria bacterium RIFCSPLOWO2_12_FULL_43_16]HBR16561.1 V-type ATP synthase subunit B [Deltaproteobacteria bacterium]
MSLLTFEYQSITAIQGPLIFVEGVSAGSLGEMVDVCLSSGEARKGQILQIMEGLAVVQVLEGTSGIDTVSSKIILKGETAKIGVSLDMLGRFFDGLGEPMDGLSPIIPETRPDINGLPINPAARDKPAHFIQTGISTIDGLNTLVRGQKLPIFSGAGLPANEIAAQIVRQAKVAGDGQFSIVFGAMGITSREAFFFKNVFEESGVMERTVAFINRAEDPTIERLFTPRSALSAAEYLAFEKGHHVLVILTDMTNYCEALREIGSAREEIPGRRGYPGYMYTDLATIYERAGRIKGKDGSITLIPILTMPDDDITHPIADLSGYITEGQIVLSRALFRKGVYPPVDVLPCLSRLMNLGIGKGKTREDHRDVADQLYASYAHGRDTRRLATIIGEEGLTSMDRLYLKFADEFEKLFIGQGDAGRSIDETLKLGWRLLSLLPKTELIRIKEEFVEKYYKAG